jgi:hypothetical protein
MKISEQEEREMTFDEAKLWLLSELPVCDIHHRVFVVQNHGPTRLYASMQLLYCSDCLEAGKNSKVLTGVDTKGHTTRIHEMSMINSSRARGSNRGGCGGGYEQTDPDYHRKRIARMRKELAELAPEWKSWYLEGLTRGDRAAVERKDGDWD